MSLQAKQNRTRVVVIVTHPIQYYAPLYRELASRGNIDLHVIYLSDAGAAAYHDVNFGRTIEWDIPLLEGYAYTVLEPGLALESLGFRARHSPKLKETLDRLGPDALLLYGYSSRMNWQALRWAKKSGCQVLYTSDSNANNSRAGWKTWVKKAVVGHFFARVDAFLCTSEANYRYLLKFGGRRERIHRVPFAIDVHRYAKDAPAAGVRRRYDFVWAGKLYPVKRPQDFINALRIVAEQTGKQVCASLVGGGQMYEEIVSMARVLPPACKVDFKGFVNQASMPQVLQEAEALVFTSERDAYGLMATEAAAAGLALVVAEGIGCIGDTVLARPGVNALIYPPGDVEALAQAMIQLLTRGDLRTRMQQASRDIAQDHDIPVAAGVIEQVVHLVCAEPTAAEGRVSASAAR